MLNNDNGQTQKTLKTHERYMYHESPSETSATSIQNSSIFTSYHVQKNFKYKMNLEVFIPIPDDHASYK